MSDRSEKSVLATYRNRLGTVPDQQIADLAGVSRTLVVNYRKKLGIPAYSGYRTPPTQTKREGDADRPFRGRRSALDAHTSILGKVPDAEVAKMAGVTAENVRTYRQRRGIPALWQHGAETAAAAPAPGASPGTNARRKPASQQANSPRPAATDVPSVVAAAPAHPPAPPSAPPAVPPTPALAAPAPVNVPAPVPAIVPPVPAGMLAWLVTVRVEGADRTYVVLASDIAAAAAEARSVVATRFPDASIESIQRVAALLAG